MNGTTTSFCTILANNQTLAIRKREQKSLFPRKCVTGNAKGLRCKVVP